MTPKYLCSDRSPNLNALITQGDAIFFHGLGTLLYEASHARLTNRPAPPLAPALLFHCMFYVTFLWPFKDLFFFLCADPLI